MTEARIAKRFAAGPESAAFALDVHLRVEPGITVLFGPSGSGKTLTLECIAGFATPDKGRILVDDRIVFDAEARVNLPPRQRPCGYVFQSNSLFPHKTLRANLEFAAAGLPRIEGARRVGEMLERFQLAEMAGRRPHELSGGQRQRGSIARALLREPRALLLDEPAQGLDAPLREELYAILREIRDSLHLPILLVTHAIEECFELATHMVVIHNGILIQTGSPLSVYRQPASSEVAALLGDYFLAPAEIASLDPHNKASVIRIFGAEIPGPYFAGHFKGDRIRLCLQPSDLRLSLRGGERALPGQIPLTLVRVVERPRTVRLHFAEGLAGDMGVAEFAALPQSKFWQAEIAPSAMRALS
ncbi:MAG: ABC transporter ATP-binding protein [Bryobacterales bacterium]|nr:ABC transporter ATP-binding protein [Bryobacterales bacterium]